jgi:AcrR family transcriptional regulator
MGSVMERLERNGARPRRRDALPLAGGAQRVERRDAAENRRQVLAAARRLFAEQGVDAVNMDDIAREAGVGKGTLYRRYAHKGELCQALLDDNARRVQADVLARLRADAATGASALAGLEYLLARLAVFNETNAPLLSAVQDASCGSRRNLLYRSAPYEWQRLTVVGALRRAIACGECAPVDVDYAADAILAPLDIDLFLFQRYERGFSRERIIASLIHLLLDGLRTRPAGGR